MCFGSNASADDFGPPARVTPNYNYAAPPAPQYYESYPSDAQIKQNRKEEKKRQKEIRKKEKKERKKWEKARKEK